MPPPDDAVAGTTATGGVSALSSSAADDSALSPSGSGEQFLDGQQEHQVVVYSRARLLHIYKSPLVPPKLDGMKPLHDWFGEYEPPRVYLGVRNENGATPGRRGARNTVDGHHGREREHGHHGNSTGAAAGTSRGSASGAGTSSDNPFANFGRFSLDPAGPGAASGAIEARELRRAQQQQSSASVDAKDGRSRRTKDGVSAPGTEAREAYGHHRESRVQGRAEEAGWRSTIAPDRRLRTAERAAGDRRGARGADTRGGRGAPAWAHDDDDSVPAWADNDTPAAHDGSGSKELVAGLLEDAASASASSVAPPPPAGVDMVQLFKAEMREKERRARELRGEPEQSVSSPPPPPAAQPPQRSVFEDLGFGGPPKAQPNGTTVDGVERSTSGGNGGDGAPSADARARSSRFAKFFDGKAPPAPQPQPAPPSQELQNNLQAPSMGNIPSGSGRKSAEPSQAEKESMNRLLSLLQLGGSQSLQAPGSIASAPLPPPAHSRGDSREFSAPKSSRFAFAGSGNGNTSNEERQRQHSQASLPPLPPSSQQPQQPSQNQQSLSQLPHSQQSLPPLPVSAPQRQASLPPLQTQPSYFSSPMSPHSAGAPVEPQKSLPPLTPQQQQAQQQQHQQGQPQQRHRTMSSSLLHAMTSPPPPPPQSMPYSQPSLTQITVPQRTGPFSPDSARSPPAMTSPPAPPPHMAAFPPHMGQRPPPGSYPFPPQGQQGGNGGPPPPPPGFPASGAPPSHFPPGGMLPPFMHALAGGVPPPPPHMMSPPLHGGLPQHSQPGLGSMPPAHHMSQPPPPQMPSGPLGQGQIDLMALLNSGRRV